MQGGITHVKDDLYKLRVTVGYDDNGNQIRPSKNIRAESKKKANIELYKWILELEENGYQKIERMTFANFYNTYWKDTAKAELSPTTYKTYISILENRVLKVLGKKKLDEIKPYQVKKLANEAKRKKGEGPLSRETKKRILSAISSVFILARDDYELVKRNPCQDIILPKEKKTKKNIQPPYTTKEIEKMFTALDDEDIYTKANVLTAFMTGARQGEIMALEEKHLNFSTNEITFNQRVVTTSDQSFERLDGLKVSDTKTMSVPQSYMDIMNELIKENKVNRAALGIEVEHTYIFGHIDGKPKSPSMLYRNWEKFVNKHDLRMIRYHDLRHTSASYLIAKNVPVKTVQERLGHSDFRTTMDIYVHGLKEVDEQASNEFEGFFKS